MKWLHPKINFVPVSSRDPAARHNYTSATIKSRGARMAVDQVREGFSVKAPLESGQRTGCNAKHVFLAHRCYSPGRCVSSIPLSSTCRAHKYSWWCSARACQNVILTRWRRGCGAKMSHPLSHIAIISSRWNHVTAIFHSSTIYSCKKSRSPS